MHSLEFHKMGEIDDTRFKYAIVVSRYEGRWVYCKHKLRNTWEIPGGKRKVGEDTHATAKRELFEETGAEQYDLKPMFAYSLISEEEKRTYGLIFFAEIYSFAELPHSEIGEVAFFEEPPLNLTYPTIHPFILIEVEKILDTIV